MRTIYLISGLLTALALGACATEYPPQSNKVETPSPAASPSMAGMNDMMKSSPNAAGAPYDLQFIDTMVEHHQSAIDMAKMTEMQAQHAELKALAKSIVSDQQKEIAEMKAWRDEWYAAKPQAMNMEMPGMMDAMKGMDMGKLKSASGKAFDLMFIDMMTAHHAGAVTMAKEALKKAEHQEIKKLAQQIIVAQQKEIEQMSKWRTAWVGAK